MSRNIKKDFPIFANNPELVFLDSTASSQKSQHMIDGLKEYLENDYSNIHRGAYSLAERSEKIYEDSKKKVAEFLGADSWREVIYSFNSTYASNLLTSSLRRSKVLQKGDKVLVSIVEHHANVVPWLILKEEIGIEIDYIQVDEKFGLDFDDLEKKLEDPKVKVVSMTHVSNVTGEVFDLEKVGEMVKNSTGQRHSSAPTPKDGDLGVDLCVHPMRDTRLFIVDASQSVPHMKVDVKKLQCDALFFTGHKLGADSGIGVLWGRKDFLENLEPGISGGGSIAWVKKDEFKSAGLPDRLEPGTPNLSGAVSLLRALEYIESIGGYSEVEKIEDELVCYFLEKYSSFEYRQRMKIIGGDNASTKVGVFSFTVEGVHAHDVAEFLAEEGICIRSGQHCAEPFMIDLGINASCRVSFWIYNEQSDIDKFFKVLKNCIKILG